MMSMKKIYLILAACASFVEVTAQNINQSVQVTNDYVSILGEVRKHDVPMSVPDTLLNFDYKFNYSVFDSPYMGAYEFSPYSIQIHPDATVFDGRKLQVRAGAGYTLHPELELVYAPVVRKDFAMSVYANGAGYWYSDNRDLSGNAGAELRWYHKKNVILFSTGYDGIFAATDQPGNSFNSGFAKLNVKSTTRGSYFFYDFNIGYRYGNEALPSAKENEHIIFADGSIGPVIKNKFKLTVDFDLRYDAWGGVEDRKAAYAGLTPRASFLLGPVKISAGARIDYADGLRIAPVADANLALFKSRLNIFAGLTGGQNIYTYYDLRSVNHRFAIIGCHEGNKGIGYEKMNAFAGISGHAGSHFEYRLKAGYAIRDNVPLFGVTGMYAFENYKLFYAEALLAVHSDRFDMTGQMHYGNYSMVSNSVCYTPASFCGTLTMRYNWNRRIYAGISAEGRSAMASPTGNNVPAYVDLGLNLEYKLNGRWGVWAKGGNLAGMKIQRVPGFEEKGPYATVGFSLVL